MCMLYYCKYKELNVFKATSFATFITYLIYHNICTNYIWNIL